LNSFGNHTGLLIFKMDHQTIRGRKALFDGGLSAAAV